MVSSRCGLRRNSPNRGRTRSTKRPWITGDPGREPCLVEIDDYVVSQFLVGLADEPGNKPGSKMSIGSIRKHATLINNLLAFAGPKERTPHGYRNMALVPFPPLVDRPTADENSAEGDFTIEEVRAMWSATSGMQSPRPEKLPPGVTPSQWWQAIVTVAACTGLRRGQLLGLACVDLTGPIITVKPARSKGRRGKSQYLAPAAVEAIESIRTPRERIFDWPHVIRWLDTQLRRLAKLAGIPAGRRFGWNGFRKCVGTMAFDVAGPDGSQAVLGHSTNRTAMKHYVAKKAQLRRAQEVIDQMPSPRPATPPPPPDPQKLLNLRFD